MKPEQALQNIFQAAALARLTAQEHDLIKQSFVVLQNFINDNAKEPK